jgi:hypothetical protein
VLAIRYFALRAIQGKEVIMRRFSWSWYIIVGCWMAYSLGGSSAFARDEYRTSVFRELTSEKPAGPMLTAPSEPVPVATAMPVVAPSELPPQTITVPQTTSIAPAYYRSPVAAQAPRLASFYGGNSARQTMNQFPHRAAIRTNPQRASHRQPKPFENAEHEPTISPYLNLDRDDNDQQEIPNYLTIVLPQLEQNQTNRNQQREIQQLRGQIQSMSSGAGITPAYDMNRSAGMNSPARYMDTAQFYSGMRK